MAHRWFGVMCFVGALLAACGGGGEPSADPADTVAATSTEAAASSTIVPETTSPPTEPSPTSSVSTSGPPSSSTTDPASSTASTSTTEVQAVDPTVEEFRSPTGNIHCRLTAEQARCSHHADTPWKEGGELPRWAEGLSFGFTEVGCISGGFVGFDVPARGRPKSTCGDSVYTAPDVTLSYGERRTVGALSCLSQQFGMTCLNSEGNGFRMATNEIALLYDREPGWMATSSSTADDVLAPTATMVLDEQTVVETESGSTRCFVTSYDFLDPPIASAECRPSEGGLDGVEWSPDGRSCAGADFNGYYVSDDVRAEARGVATFGCTTDVTPLSGLLDIPIRPLPEGEAVSVSGITCLSTGPAIVCYNQEGNGMLTSPDEVSFFYSRNV